MSMNVDCSRDWSREYVPFKYFVRPTQLPTSEPSSAFTCFPKLPVELQLQIYNACDGPTLFNLMHASSNARKEASKRFWADNTTWYSIRSDSELTHDRRNTIVFHCPEFGNYITQVVIDLIRIELTFTEDDGSLTEHPFSTTRAKARFFWNRVQKIFPFVTTVVLNGLVPNEGFPLVIDPTRKDVTPTIARVVQEAPSHIRVLIALQLHFQVTETSYNLYEIVPGNKPSWKLIEKCWAPRRILLPERRFTNYPGGAFLNLISSSAALLLEKRGLWQLRIDSYLKYSSLGSTLPCLDVGCEASFTDRSEWEEHLRNNQHHHYHFGTRARGPFEFHENTPSDIKAALMARCERVDARTRELEALSERLKRDWGDESDESSRRKRRSFEKAYQAQLRDYFVDSEEQTVDGQDDEWIYAPHNWLTPNYDGNGE
jgi:hypothetical protein